MSLLNERLYRTESFNNLDLGAYLTAISEDLISVQMPRDMMVELTCETEEIIVGPREAIPCGLIVNELVTNSLKHAFKTKAPTHPQVYVRLHRAKDDLIHLQVADNGGGYSETIDYESSKTLGMRLVQMLGQDQLGGTTKIYSENGAVFSLAFFPNQDVA
jgi:two-component sensor histidine kinase